MHVWAPGAFDLVMPEDVGFPIGSEGFKSFRVEIHYDNPKRKVGVIDNSKLRLFLTNTPRAHNAGIMHMGDPLVMLGRASSKVTATPGNNAISTWDFECPTSCTKNILSLEQNITVFKEILHMHKAGSRMVQTHFRDGEILRENFVDYYDFNSAGGIAILQKPYEVMAGDSFKTSCTYQSSGGKVFFGLSSDDEMCITYLMYYPALTSKESQDIYCGAYSTNSNCEGALNMKSQRQLDHIFGTPCEKDITVDSEQNVPPQSSSSLISTAKLFVIGSFMIALWNLHS